MNSLRRRKKAKLQWINLWFQIQELQDNGDFFE